jgi:hypothetical protein
MVATRLSNSIGLASNSSHPVAMAFSRSLSIACADMPMIGMSRVCGSFLETPHGFPTIVVRHFEVGQDHVRVLGRGQSAAFLAVLRCEHLEVAVQLEARLDKRARLFVEAAAVEKFG